MTRNPVAAAILAGGQARRFGGVHKPLLVIGRLGGGPSDTHENHPGRAEDASAPEARRQVRIIDRQLSVLRQVADPIFIVAPDPAPYQDLGVAIVADILPRGGSLVGIYTAIVTSPRDRTLVVAGDLPFLALPLLQRLTRPGVDADVVIPKGPRGYEPLCAVYSKACAPPMRQRIDGGLLRAGELPEGLKVDVIEPDVLASYDPDGLLFVNVNTPHDYERARGLFESMLQPPEDRITDKHSPS